MALLKLLMIEDKPEAVSLPIQAFKNAGYSVNHQQVTSAAGLLAALQASAWDAIISGFEMPQFSALDALRVLTATEWDIPFIVVSAAAGEDKAVAAMQAGAADYLTKNNIERLVPATEGAIRQAAKRRQQRQAAQEQEEMRLRMEGIIASAMDAIITVNEAQKIVLFNRAAEQMFGYDAAAVLGREIDFLLSPGYSQEPLQRMRQLAGKQWPDKNLIPVSSVYGLKRSGEEFPIETSISQHEVNKQRYYTVFIRDITETLAATRILREEKQRLELALVGGGLGLWDWTLSSGRVVMSEHWAAIMGYEASEMVETMDHIMEQVHPEDQAGLAEVTRQYFENPTSYYRHEYRIRNREGEWRWVQTTGKIFERDAAGAPLRMVGTHQDITEQKSAAEKIRKMEVEMLNLKIAEQRAISSSFLNGQEEERKRLARELHDGIGQLLSALKIQLSMEAASAEVRQSVDHIIRETVRINNNLMPLVLQDFGLEAGLRQLIEKYKSLGQADIYFYCDLKGMRLPQELEIGVFRIVQEATNNAVKYAQASQISVQLTQQEENLLLMVEDDGIGFDPEEKMQRLDKGFGLLNMHYRAETLNGKLLIESSPGHGCLVNVVLPILKY